MIKRKLSYDESSLHENMLSVSQKRALKCVLQGQNILISGEPLCGKTECVLQILCILNSRGIKTAFFSNKDKPDEQNLIDFMGYDHELLKTKSVEIISNDVLKKKFKCSNIQSYRVLIIDDISLIDSFLIELTDYTLQKIKNNKILFGGLQIVFSGDFYQIPANNFLSLIHCNIFWKTVEACVIVERVSSLYQKTINRLRKKDFLLDDNNLFNARVGVRLSCEDQGIMPTKISLNKNADALNLEKLSKLKSDEKFFFYKCESSENLFEKKIILKIGCQVMLTFNLQDKLSGSLGKVVSWSKDLPVVKFIDGQSIPIPYVSSKLKNDDSSVSFIPLKLAWYTNVETADSFSIDAAEIDNCLKPGEFWFILSKIKNIDCLTIKNFSKIFTCGSDIEKFYESPFLVQKAIKNHDMFENGCNAEEINAEELIAFTRLLSA